MKPDGRVYKDGVFTGKVVTLLGMTPKYYVDCMEWMANTFHERREIKRE